MRLHITVEEERDRYAGSPRWEWAVHKPGFNTACLAVGSATSRDQAQAEAEREAERQLDMLQRDLDYKYPPRRRVSFTSRAFGLGALAGVLTWATLMLLGWL